MDKAIEAILSESGLAVALLLLACMAMGSALRIIWQRLNVVVDTLFKLSQDNTVAMNNLTTAVDKVADRIK